MASAVRHINECPVCWLPYEDPKVLPCDHSLCVNCVTGITKGSKIKCPLCNKVHKVDKIRADFRLLQFLEALNQKNKSVEEPSKPDEGARCEICRNHSVWFHCEQCEQWICKDCKTLHVRTKSTKDHSVVPVPIIAQQTKDEFDAKSIDITMLINAQSTSIKFIENVITKLNVEQANALQVSHNIRKKSLKDANDYFDAIDAQITQFAQDNIEKLEIQKGRLENQLNKLLAKWEQLEELITKDVVTLAIEGKNILTEAIELYESRVDYLHVTEVEINVLECEAADTCNTATIELVKDGKRQRLNFAQGSVNQPQPQRLSSLIDKSLVVQKKVDLGTSSYTVRKVDQELWICQEFGYVDIYNQDLDFQWNIFDEAWGTVLDITPMDNNQIILSAINGLFNLSCDGWSHRKIAQGAHHSACFYDKKLYSYSSKPPTITVYEDSGTVDYLNEFKLQFNDGAMVTIIASRGRIYACNESSHKIHILSLTGETITTLGKRGRCTGGYLTMEGYLKMPYVCQEDEDGTLLVADSSNNRLQTVDSDGNWKVMQMQPTIRTPCSAVFTDNKLYVITDHGKRLQLLHASS